MKGLRWLLLLPVASAFGDESDFTALVAAARQRDAALAAERHTLAAENENLRAVFAEFLPQVSLSSSYAWTQRRRNNQNVDDNVPEQTVLLNQRLLDAPRQLRYRADQLQFTASKNTLLMSEQTLAREVIQSRLDIHMAREQHDLLRKRRDALGEQLHLVRRRQQGGVGDYLEVALVEAEWETLNADVAAARSLLQNRRHSLLQLTGVAADSLPVLRPDFRPPPLSPLESLQALARDRNPALVAGRLQTAALRQRQRAAVAAVVPTFNLVAEHAFQARGDHNSGLSLQLQMPLFSGGALAARRKQTEWQYFSALQSVLDFERQIAENLSLRHNAARSLIRQQSALKNAVQARESSLAKTERAWEIGVRPARDVLDARQTLFNARLQLRNLNYQYLGLLADIQQTAGTLNDEFLKMLDGYFTARPARNSARAPVGE